MIGRLDEIHFQLPIDIETVIPCQLSEDHQNQVGMLRCPECNPNDFDAYSEYLLDCFDFCLFELNLLNEYVHLTSKSMC